MSRQRIEQWLEASQPPESLPSDASKSSSHLSSQHSYISRLSNASHSQSSSNIWSGTKGTGDRIVLRPGRAPRHKYRGHVCGFCSRPDIDEPIEALLKTDGHFPKPLFGLEPGGVSQIHVESGRWEAVGTVSSNGGARVSINDQISGRTTARFEGFWNGQDVVLVNTTKHEQQLTLDLRPTHDLTSGYPGACPSWRPRIVPPEPQSIAPDGPEWEYTFDIKQGSQLPERPPKNSTYHKNWIVTVRATGSIHEASVVLPGTDALDAEWELLPREWEKLPEEAKSFSSLGSLQLKLLGGIWAWSTPGRIDKYKYNYLVDCPPLSPTLIKVKERLKRPSRYTKDFS